MTPTPLHTNQQPKITPKILRSQAIWVPTVIFLISIAVFVVSIALYAYSPYGPSDLLPISLIGMTAAPMFAVPSIIGILRVPDRIEITPNAIRVYGLTWFRFMERSEITAIRLVPNRIPTTFEITFKSQKRFLLVDLYTERGVVGKLLTQWSQDLPSTVPPQSTTLQVSRTVKEDLRSAVTIFAIFLVIYLVLALLVLSVVTVLLLLLALIVLLVAPVLVNIYNQTRHTLDAEGVETQVWFNQKSVPFDRVEVIQIQVPTAGEEKIFLCTNDRDLLWEYSSREPEYAQVRDFIIQSCPHAKITGLTNPSDRLLNTLPPADPQPTLGETT